MIGNPYVTFEGFVKAWDSKLTTAIKRFKLRADTEDVKQQIYLELLAKKYLDRFDSEKATISTWVYGFVNNCLRRLYNCGKRDVIYNGISIMDDFDDDAVGSALFLNIFTVDTKQDQELSLLIQDLLVALSDSSYAAHSTASDGTPRDMKTVVELTLKGFTPKEIASKFETSVQFIYKLFKKMSSVPECVSLLN